MNNWVRSTTVRRNSSFILRTETANLNPRRSDAGFQSDKPPSTALGKRNHNIDSRTNDRAKGWESNKTSNKKLDQHFPIPILLNSPVSDCSQYSRQHAVVLVHQWRRRSLDHGFFFPALSGLSPGSLVSDSPQGTPKRLSQERTPRQQRKGKTPR